jgi:hypothetical protein
MSKKNFKFINLFSIKIFIMKFVFLQNLKYARKKQKLEIIKKKKYKSKINKKSEKKRKRHKYCQNLEISTRFFIFINLMVHITM